MYFYLFLLTFDDSDLSISRLFILAYIQFQVSTYTQYHTPFVISSDLASHAIRENNNKQN